MTKDKLDWQGNVVAVQPRIRLTRSFDQRSHTYLGYALRLQGQIGDDEGQFLGDRDPLRLGRCPEAVVELVLLKSVVGGDVAHGRPMPYPFLPC